MGYQPDGWDRVRPVELANQTTPEPEPAAVTAPGGTFHIGDTVRNRQTETEMIVRDGEGAWWDPVYYELVSCPHRDEARHTARIAVEDTGTFEVHTLTVTTDDYRLTITLDQPDALGAVVEGLPDLMRRIEHDLDRARRGVDPMGRPR